MYLRCHELLNLSRGVLELHGAQFENRYHRESGHDIVKLEEFIFN
jgi:hypothetical protein